MCADTFAGCRYAQAASISARRARAIARFGDAALAPRPAARILRGNEAHIHGQLPRRVKPGEIAEFGDDGDRDEEWDAPQDLQRLHDRVGAHPSAREGPDTGAVRDCGVPHRSLGRASGDV